jgi:hypothetical protein
VPRSSTSLWGVEAAHKTQEGPAALTSAATKRGRRAAHRNTWFGQAVQIDITPCDRRVTSAAGINTRSPLIGADADAFTDRSGRTGVGT